MILILLILVSGFSSGTSQGLSDPEIQTWATELDALLSPNRQLFRFADLAATSEGKVSEDCRLSLNIVRASLTEKYRYSESSRWAFKLLDAMMKIPPGILEGGSPMYGSFDECMSISADPSAWKDLRGVEPYNKAIQGHYCPSIVLIKAASQNSSVSDVKDFLKDLEFDQLVAWRYDLCMPSACSEKDSTYLIQHMATGPFQLEVKGMLCHGQEPVQVSSLQIASISIFVVLGLLLILATGVDYLQRRRREQGNGTVSVQETDRLLSVLLCFSVLANAQKLLTVQESKDSLAVVHGMRFLSTAYIVLAHSYAFTFLLIMGNLFKIFEMFERLPAQVINNSVLSVDSFFFLSGLLVAYVTLSELKKRDKITWRFIASFYFHRFWRLTPPIFFVILFVFVWPLFGSGPLWDPSTMIRSSRCQVSGWATLLYVQNFAAHETMCMEHSWYLAVDMQLYIVSPVILIFLHSKRFLGLAINSLFLLVSLLIPFLIGYVNDLPPHVIYNKHMNVRKIANLEFAVMQMPWCRMGPFCVGIFLGYILNSRKDFKIPKWAVCLGWCLSTACNTTVLFGVQPWTSGKMPSKWIGNLYLATHGTAWSLGLAWTVFACATGHGGVVNRILSMKTFVPLSRISYMIYLIHPFFIFSFVGALRERMIYTHYLQAVLYFGFLTLSIGTAFMASLAVEAPFVALERVLFRRSQTKVKEGNVPLKHAYKKLDYDDVNLDVQGQSE